MSIAAPTMDAIRAEKWIGRKWGAPFNRNMEWRHPCIAGIVIKHCGHPTALRPYHILLHAGCLLNDEDCEPIRGTFQRLAEAQAAVFRALEAATPTPHS